MPTLAKYQAHSLQVLGKHEGAIQNRIGAVLRYAITEHAVSADITYIKTLYLRHMYMLYLYFELEWGINIRSDNM